jgi:hypothetical protein
MANGEGLTLLAKNKIVKLAVFAVICIAASFLVFSYLTSAGETDWPPAIVSTALVCCAYTLFVKDVLSKH